MNRKYLPIVLILLAISLIFTGCAPTGTTPAPEETPESNELETDTGNYPDGVQEAFVRAFG